MSGDLILLMGQAICGGYLPRTDHPVASNIETLVDAMGSGRSAARALDVAESTLRGWRKGAIPRRSAQSLVATMRTAIHPIRNPGYYTRAYTGVSELTIRGLIRVSKDSRTRTIYPGRYIPRRVMQGILRAWSTADDNRAERLLLKAIDEYYQPMDFDEIVGVWFE